ncbi:MAG: RsmD family RNA methyltransferase, partial [Candidatus Methanomethyliaceae archaeon]|nr:RsmD family RNA methyltransferase [Candidatus Methanomethyliaceae archaeon]
MRLIKVKEGTTILLVPDFSEYYRKGSYDPSRATVFYNPKMEFSRDIGVMVLREIAKNRSNLLICDPLAGIGARGIRYTKEVEGISKCIINDINKSAIPIIMENIKINNLENIKVECKDANLLLIEHSKRGERFDFIDLDPFGSPVNFFEASIRALKNGGILAFTATDTAPLCGVHQKACFRKYGAISFKTEFCHEVG